MNLPKHPPHPHPHPHHPRSRDMVDDKSTSYPSRRSFLEKPLAFAVAVGITTTIITTTTTSTPRPAQALDIDAFVQKEMANEVCDDRLNKKCQPKLSDDQALCRFGQPSQETGQACLRANMSTQRGGGGLDAFGKVNRGNYLRCKATYVDDQSPTSSSNKLVKQWNCQ